LIELAMRMVRNEAPNAPQAEPEPFQRENWPKLKRRRARIAPAVTDAGWSRRLIVAHRSRIACTIPWTPSGEHRHERSRPQYQSDAGEPALRHKNPLRRIVPLAREAPRGEGAPSAPRHNRLPISVLGES